VERPELREQEGGAVLRRHNELERQISLRSGSSTLLRPDDAAAGDDPSGKTLSFTLGGFWVLDAKMRSGIAPDCVNWPA
jgi:hypothetical protein